MCSVCENMNRMTHGSLPMRHRGFERLRERRHGVALAQEMEKIEDETLESALKKCVSLISTMQQFLEIGSEEPYVLDKLTGTVLGFAIAAIQRRPASAQGQLPRRVERARLSTGGPDQRHPHTDHKLPHQSANSAMLPHSHTMGCALHM